MGMFSIIEIMADRIKKDEDRFYLPIQAIGFFDEFCFVRRKKWLGVSMDDDVDKILLPMIFDEIEVLEAGLLKVRIDSLLGVYSLTNTKWCFMPSYDGINYDGQNKTIELILDTKHGLYSLKYDKILIPTKYDDVTTYDDCEYLWVRIGENYHFVHKESGKFISLIDAQLAYDTSHGMFAKGADGNVYCADEYGLDKATQLRHFIIDNKGRGKLHNYKLHILNVVDIYGYILD